jgi:hypothetical protein
VQKPAIYRTLAHVEASGKPSGICKSKNIESVRQSPLRCNDTRHSQDECYEDIKICEVKVINIDEVYCNKIEGSAFKDVERNNGVVMKAGRVTGFR